MGLGAAVSCGGSFHMQDLERASDNPGTEMVLAVWWPTAATSVRTKLHRGQ